MNEPLNGSPPRVAGAKARLTVLLVEDEDGLRAVIRRLLQEEGYTVLEASNGARALQLLAHGAHQEVGLVLTDLRMPVMDGRQLAAALARLHPNLPIIFMSGFTAQLMDMRLVTPELAFLPKPFRDDDLLATVRGQLKPR
jgi:two-component system cell cycle sensor histidine kinase/response regulator CckA